MAMALLDAGVPSARFQVDAMEISTRALALAEAATYGRNSFRGSGAMGREHHFEPAPRGRRVCERVRRQVRFRHGNMLACPFAPGRDRFDIVFCRNLLIYFDRAAQDRAIQTLGALLKPEGLLFVGSSEGGLALNHAFVSAKLPMSFAFRRPHARADRSRTATKRRAARATAAAPAPAAAEARPVAAVTLEEIRAVADQGRFDEAAALCEEHVRAMGPSADAFCLLGVVRDAAGEVDAAAASYRKALYLEPAHADAVMHLALLVERQGREAEAKVLWSRARRLTAGGAR